MFSLEKFDPRAKFMLLLCLSTAALAVKNIWFLGGLLVFTSLIMAMGRISISAQFRQARIALGIVVFLFIIQALFIRTGDPLVQIKEFTLITTGGLAVGAYLSIRILIIILSALIILTGESRDYLLAMTQCKIPYEIAFMTMVGFHFFPLLKEEALDVFYSVQLRGTELKKTSLPKKLQTYSKISLPILVGALEKAKAMAAAMEARCFRLYPYRTYMRKLTLKTKDKAALVLLPLLTAAFIFFGVTAPVSAADAQHSTSAEEMQTTLSWSGDPAHSQTITWKGQNKKEGYVLYWSDSGSKKTPQKVKASVEEVRSQEYYRYEANLSDLRQNTEYTYQIVSGGKGSEEKTFVTAKENTDAFSFLYLGDVQYELREEDYEKWGRFVRDAYDANPEIAFALMGGDMVDKSPDMRDWDAFFRAASPVFSEINMMTVPGNHETSITPSFYLKMTAVPENGPEGLEEEFYSFSYGNCHFIGLNSCYLMEERINAMGEEAWQKQLERVNAWLAEDLKSSDKTWKIVTMHHPAYAIEDDSRLYEIIKQNWVPIFEKYGVQMVFCGHQHVYMRTKEINGVTYIMGNSGQKQSHYEQDNSATDYIKAMDSGKSNYQIIQVDGDKLELTSYDEAGDTIDSWKANSQGSSITRSTVVMAMIAAVIIAALGVLFFFKRSKRARKS